MYHQRCGGVGQAAGGGKVPHTAQQRACCAAHQHQCLRKEQGEQRVGHVLSQQVREIIIFSRSLIDFGIQSLSLMMITFADNVLDDLIFGSCLK